MIVRLINKNMNIYKNKKGIEVIKNFGCIAGMKKIVFILAIIVCHFASFSAAVTPIVWKKGSGTEQKPFLIESVENLYYLASQVNSGKDYENIYFCLSNDIDLKGRKENQWQPIGNNASPFRGNFNGNNFEIKNLYIENPVLDYAGLFGCIHSGKIENLGISVTSFVKGKDYTGGIVGYQMDGNIYNCHNQASVNGNNNVGGIVGYQYNVSIQSCYNTGAVSGRLYIGGIAGMAYAKAQIYNCYNVGNISGENHAGGIVGKIDGYNSKSMINSCYQVSMLNKIELVGTGISVEISNSYYTDVSGFRNERFGNILTSEQMKSDSFVVLLNSLGNKWIEDKLPYVNSGYPILTSMKYSGIFTNEPTEIKEKEAILWGNFTAKNEKILQKGFEYKAEDALQFTLILADFETFSLNLTDLKPYTKYEYRAFVITDKGKIVGKNIEFRTLPEKCHEHCTHGHHHHEHEHEHDH